MINKPNDYKNTGTSLKGFCHSINLMNSIYWNYRMKGFSLSFIFYYNYLFFINLFLTLFLYFQNISDFLIFVY